MSDNIHSWFHCGRCNSLFRSPSGEMDDRLCSECGRDPSLGIDATHPNPAADSDYPTEPERISRKRRKPDYFTAKLVSGWLLMAILIVMGGRLLWNHPPADDTSASEEQADPGPSAEDVALLAEFGPFTTESLYGFLSSGTPEARNQFVLNPIQTAARMARFHELNPLVNISPQTVSLVKSAVLHLPSGRAIETLWNTSDGRQIEAVLVQQDNEWRLDWEHFVRFSTYPWSLFLAGSGDDVGEFRLLARQRLAEELKDAENLSIVLYAPRFGSLTETGFQSPEFVVKRDTRNGRLLDAAFRLEKSGGRLFQLDIPNPNPEGLIRVRVKVRRVQDDVGSRFELQEVIACHWYSEDAPGVELPDLPEGK